MESSRKRFGLIKGKLVKSLYRAAAAPKPSSAIQYGSSSSRVPNYPSEGFVVNQVDRPSTIHHLHHHHNDHQQPKQNLVPYNPNSTSFSSSSAGVDFILNPEQVTIPHKPKISFYIPPTPESTDRGYYNSSTATTHNYAKVDNENADIDAANYISRVQERFRLERINSERKQAQQYFTHEEVLQFQQ